MTAEAKQSCYEGTGVSSFQIYLEKSGEHNAILQCVQNVLPGEFLRLSFLGFLPRHSRYV